jgi:hypothetical protein
MQIPIRTEFKDDEDRTDYGADLMFNVGDVFAKALDHAGWMIVPQTP